MAAISLIGLLLLGAVLWFLLDGHEKRWAARRLPEVPVPEGMGYENLFRIAIVEFMDAHNFCLGRVKRSCIHFVTPIGQISPFETYNIFYRDAAARQRMTASREAR